MAARGGSLNRGDQRGGTDVGNRQTRTGAGSGIEIEVPNRLVGDGGEGDGLVELADVEGLGHVWSRRIRSVPGLGSGHGERAGCLQLQTVEVTRASAVYLGDHGGIQFRIVEADVVKLSVEVGGTVGSDL